MITNQIMKRDFMESKISQRTKDGFFNATELLTVFNSMQDTGKRRFHDFWENNNTKAFLAELEQEILNNGDSRQLKTHETTRGRNGATWTHPYLFVKFAMWLSPKFELQIIKWVYDNLIDFRVQAGDHFREMCATISTNYADYWGHQAGPFIYQKEAKFLNSLVYGSFDGGRRNELSEKELGLLNELQQLNIKLIQSKQFSLKERRNKLADHASNYKMIRNW